MLFEKSSTNIYIDLGLDDADAMQRKAVLAAHIEEIVRDQGIEVARDSTLAGVGLPELKHWLSGKFRTAREDDLRACLSQLQRSLSK